MCDVISPDVYDMRKVKARKKHACCACAETILPGHVYVVHEGLWDGEWDRFKQCLRCHAIFTALVNKQGWDPCVALDLNCGETWSNVFGELPVEVQELAFLSGADMQAGN